MTEKLLLSKVSPELTDIEGEDPDDETCDGRCDVCPDFDGCGSEKVLIICLGVCAKCEHLGKCKFRVNGRAEGYTAG